MNYAIIDIETTGGSPVSEKITEIAIFIFNGEKIVDEFVTLINSEKKIPYHITQLTGITNSMVAESPKFYEVARTIIEKTENTIFVAHNVNFDYSFIRQEFKNLGYNFQRDKLCTVNLSRKIIPGHKSYSLGKICGALGITINDRHRAAGDAYATVKLFEYLKKVSGSAIDFSDIPGVALKDLHPNLDPESIKKIPDEPGVYYFYNDKNNLIYIGKSKNIKTRVLSHFRNSSTKKAIEMRNDIASIDFEITGCELIALLQESYEIKQNLPFYNRAQRRAISQYGLYTYIHNAGYIRFEIVRNSFKNQVPICSFSGLKSGKGYMQKLVDKYELCQKLCGLYSSSGACFYHEIMECRGACLGKEPPESYNYRAQKIIDSHQFRHNSFFIIENGRNIDEIAVVMVQNGKYLGYGYFYKDDYENNFELLADCIQKRTDDRDIQQILRNYLKNGRPIDLIPF